MTDRVKSKLKSLSIDLVAVPANMTHFFQPLDLTVNGAAKKLTWKEFIQYYSTAVQQQLQSGKSAEEIKVDLRMSIMKPLHAQWLVNIYTYFTIASHGRVLFLRAGRRQESVVSWTEPPHYHQRTPLNKFILISFLTVAGL